MSQVLLLLLMSLAGKAQTAEAVMPADRPGFSNSAHLAGRGVLQFENGLRIFSKEAAGQRRGLGLDSNVRFGATKWLELRLYADTVVLRSPQDPGQPRRIVGASDLQPGFKFPIIGRERASLRVTGIVKTSLPTGHPTQSAAGYQPGTELLFEQALPANFSIGGTWNLTRLGEESHRWHNAGSLQVNRTFRGTWNALAEVYASNPLQPGGGNEWFADVALTKHMARNVALDVWVARTVHGPQAWFAAMGVSTRFRP